GHEIEAPMAIAVLGGLTTATFLNLVVLPEALIRLQNWLGLGGGLSKDFSDVTDGETALAIGKV
ncbi:MAG: hypothetical protein WBP38_03730, partial [Hyphomicrobium sp.]